MYKCDDDIVVVRAFNCYEIKEYFKGKMVCPVIEEQSPFKAMFFSKGSDATLRKEIALPNTFKTSVGEWLIVIDDRVDENVDERLAQLLQVLENFSFPKPVKFLGKMKLNIKEENIEREEYAKYVQLRIHVESKPKSK